MHIVVSQHCFLLELQLINAKRWLVAQTNMHLSADIIMYLSHNCEVHEDLYVLNSIQLACNLSSVVSVAFCANICLGDQEGI